MRLPLTVADIAPDDERFVSEGCGEWSTDLAPIAEPGQPFGDGTYIVGLDIAPGRYRAADSSDSCFWLRLNDFRIFGGKYQTYEIRNNIGGWGATVLGGDESAIVDIEPTDTGFYSEGCGTWTADLTPIVTPGQPFVDGTYLVGDEIAPGRYRAREPSGECYWARLADFSGVYGEGGNYFIIRRAGPTSIVDIAPEDAGFYSRGCGTWSDDLSPVAMEGEPFPDGTYLVGVDIAPGRYRASGATDRCLWYRLDGFGGIYGAYEGAYAISIGSFPAVDVGPSDAGLLSIGCGTWTNATTPITEPGEPFGDGVYLVGIDVAPGRYRASTPTGDCYWWRLNGFRGDASFGYAPLADITAFADSTIVDIFETDVGFRTSGCGSWSEDTASVSEPKRSFGTGTYIVGAEIAPGRYFASAPSERCEWRRLGDFSGHEDYSELGTGGGRAWSFPSRLAVVDIRASDAGFHSSGCGEWTQTFEPRVTPAGPPGDGFFLVGIEVAPGRYRATTPESCTFERRSQFSGEYRDGNRYIDEGWAGHSRVLAIVDIEPTDAGFESEGCGWTDDLTPISQPGQPFGDGTYIVGIDIEPGRYRASPSGGRCSWTRLSKFGGSYGNDTGIVGRWWVRGQSAVVDVAPTDAGFHSEGCGEWSPDLSPVLAPGEPFTRGTYLVGVDLPPGRYRATAVDPQDSCYWARLSGFGGTGEEVIARSEFRGESFIAEIELSDAGFTTDGDCGVWMPDSGTPVRSVRAPVEAGVYYVGTEVSPGRYRAASRSGESSCRWWRLGGFGGSRGEVLGSYDLELFVAYSFIVDIAPTDAGFASTRCGTWTTDLTPIRSPGDRVPSGSWLVGAEVAPGRYHNTPGEQNIKGSVTDLECTWQRVSGFGGSEAETIESGSAEPGAVTTVTIAATDAGFVSRGCGNWTLVPP